MSLYSSLFLVVGTLVAGLLTYLQYNDFFSQHKTKALILGTLRFLSYIFVVLLLVNLQLVSSTSEKQKQKLIFLTDASKSMKNFTSEEKVQDFIKQVDNEKELQQKFDIAYFSFGSSLQQMEDFNTFKLTESQTNIAKAIKEIGEVFKNQKYTIALVSDGNQSIGEDYTFLAKQLNQQIIPVVVGDTAKVDDLKIDRINNNNYVFLDNKFTVEIFVSYDGNQQFSSPLKITQNQQEVARQNLRFSPDKNTHRLSIELLASKKGIQKYEISIDAFEGEVFIENNIASFSIEVIDNFSKVLILSDKIHPDIGMLQRSLGKSKQRKVDVALLQDFESDLSDYNVVILYQPNPAFLNSIKKIKELGLNALLFTGTKTDYSFVQQQFPYFIKEPSASLEDYYPLFDSGFNVYQQDDIGFLSYPPLQDVFGEVITKGNTSTLLYQQIKGFKTDSPMLFFAVDEGNRYGFFMGENLWRWRSQFYVDNKNFNTFDDFTGKIVQYLTSSSTKKRLIVDYESLYTSKLEKEIRATYFDANYQLDNTAQVSIKLIQSETNETSVYPMIWKGNYFGFLLKNINSGEYNFEVSVNESEYETVGKFSLDEEDKEKKIIIPDLASMQEIAYKESMFLFSEPLSLITYLKQEDALKPNLKSVKKNQSLIDWQYLLFFLMVSLSGEWFIRKYNGLI